MVSYLQEQSLTEPERGDKVRAVKLPGRRVTTSRSLSARPFGLNQDHGFTLIELVITITVLTILTLGVVPLLKISVKRQKEEQLRAALRQMRTAIDEFHRDTVGMPRIGLGGPAATATTTAAGFAVSRPAQQGSDQRSHNIRRR